MKKKCTQYFHINGKMLLFVFAAFFFSTGVDSTLHAQDWARTNIKDLQRVDLRDLGYPSVNEIPENSSAITSC
ncbi:MAG: hypothetical protein IPN67_21915 [Bacteroidales bacterium]|nr:hypothetical protein [Bacteroidales bacterium]